MCEIIKSLETSDWIDIITALIAGFSAYLLYKTFLNQEKSSRLQNENIKLEKKARVAEYMPKFNYYNIQAELPYDIKEMPDGNIHKIYNSVAPVIFKLELKVQENIILLSKIEFKLEAKTKGKINDYELDYTEVTSENLNNFISPQDLKTFFHSIQVEVSKLNDEIVNYLVKEDFENRYICFFRLTVEDTLGTSYIIVFKKNLNERNTTIIEYKKA